MYFKMDTPTAMSIHTPLGVSATGLTEASDEHVLIYPDEYRNANLMPVSSGISVPNSHDMLTNMVLSCPQAQAVSQGTRVQMSNIGSHSSIEQKSTISVGIQVNLCCCSPKVPVAPLDNSHVLTEACESSMMSQTDHTMHHNSGPAEVQGSLDVSNQVQNIVASVTSKMVCKHLCKDKRKQDKKRRKVEKPGCKKSKKQRVLTRRSTKSTLERRYLCEGCGIKFVHKATYDRHLQELRGKASENKCSFCDATFTFQCKLKQHIAAKHPELTSSLSKERPVICHICGIQLQTSIGMNKHMRIHDGDKPFLCKYCPKAFRWHTGLEYHERIHTGERPFKCPNCPKAFTNPSDLARHQTVHTGKKPHLCHQCGKGFTQSGTLNAHIKSKHTQLAHSLNINPTANMSILNNSCPHPMTMPLANLKQPDIFVCHVCGKNFSQDHMLDAHVRKSHQQLHSNMTLEGGVRCGTLEDMKLQLATCNALNSTHQVFNLPSCVPTEREIAEVVVNMLAQ